MTVTSVAVATTKSIFGLCNCTVDSDVGKGNFSLVLGIFHVCGDAHVRSHLSPCMDCLTLPYYRDIMNDYAQMSEAMRLYHYCA